MRPSELFLRSDARDEARALVLEHHYSGKWPAAVVLAVTWHEPGGLFGDRGPAVAAVAFGPPNYGWSERALELKRLVRKPGRRLPLTSLVAAASSEIRRQRLANLLISYADPEHGHHGGVYQAASWRYHGNRFGNPGYPGLIINGNRVHGRSIYKEFGTTRWSEVVAALPSAKVEKWPFTPKHLYWRALNRRGKAKAKRLGLKSMPYPKPGRDQDS